MLVFKSVLPIHFNRLSGSVTADRQDTAKVRETARKRMDTLLKPLSTYESDLFQSFNEVIKCLNRFELCDEFDSTTDLEIINRSTISINDSNIFYYTSIVIINCIFI